MSLLLCLLSFSGFRFVCGILVYSTKWFAPSSSTAPFWAEVHGLGAGKLAWSSMVTQERKLHINELKAAFLGLQALAKDLHGGCILVEMDNTAMVAAVNWKGSARSRSLSRVAKNQWNWCKK